jgi:hypothetical protein
MSRMPTVLYTLNSVSSICKAKAASTKVHRANHLPKHLMDLPEVLQHIIITLNTCIQDIGYSRPVDKDLYLYQSMPCSCKQDGSQRGASLKISSFVRSSQCLVQKQYKAVLQRQTTENCIQDTSGSSTKICMFSIFCQTSPGRTVKVQTVLAMHD